jgi:heme-degrading monooxygenase HmoA
MNVARIAVFDDPVLAPDDDRRAQSLRELLRTLPGFVAGYHLHEEGTGRLMSITIWESERAMREGEELVALRPEADQRGMQPTRVEQWVVESTFRPRRFW